MQMGYDFDSNWPAGAAAEAVRARFAGLADGAPRPGESDAPAGTGAGDATAETGVLRQPDWSALRARFAAIHALRRSLATPLPDAVAAPLAGGFVATAEDVLAVCRNGTAVNPVYWANRKTPGTITRSVAVSPHAVTED